MIGETNKLDIIELLRQNINGESDTIFDYSVLLEKVAQSDFDYETKSSFEIVISEIIGDELNHIEKLTSLYTLITGIEAKKD